MLERAIADLPEDMRAAIVLRDVQGFSYDEIARIWRPTWARSNPASAAAGKNSEGWSGSRKLFGRYPSKWRKGGSA